MTPEQAQKVISNIHKNGWFGGSTWPPGVNSLQVCLGVAMRQEECGGQDNLQAVVSVIQELFPGRVEVHHRQSVRVWIEWLDAIYEFNDHAATTLADVELVLKHAGEMSRV